MQPSKETPLVPQIPNPLSTMQQLEEQVQQLVARVLALQGELQQPHHVVLREERTVTLTTFDGDGDVGAVDLFEEEVRDKWEEEGLTEKERLRVVVNNVSKSVKDRLKLHLGDSLKDSEKVLGTLCMLYGDQRTINSLCTCFF